MGDRWDHSQKDFSLFFHSHLATNETKHSRIEKERQALKKIEVYALFKQTPSLQIF